MRWRWHELARCERMGTTALGCANATGLYAVCLCLLRSFVVVAAVSNVLLSIAIVMRLLNIPRVAVNVRNADGNTPLHYYCQVC